MFKLLSFISHRDPFERAARSQSEQFGPILSILESKKVQEVLILNYPNMGDCTQKLLKTIKARFPGVRADSMDLPIVDDRSLDEIWMRLNEQIPDILQGDPDTECLVNLSSGTAEMTAAWMMLEQIYQHAFKLVQVKTPTHSNDRPSVEVISSAVTTPRPSRPKHFAYAVAEPEEPFLDNALKHVGCVGEHPLFNKAVKVAETLSQHMAPVLIQGETGTGKDVFARLIHYLSPRRAKPLVMVNCAALPEELAESLLFGHAKGSFTGAHAPQIGKFEAADGSTLFLDEIGELTPRTQAKLLRIVEDGAVTPLGSVTAKKVDVRIIAATNRDLKQDVGNGAFREDLYYRLRVGEFWLPTLKERAADIPLLAQHILSRINRTLREPKQLSISALVFLEKSRWPGNIRDLHNTLERSALFCPKSIIDIEDLHEHGAMETPRKGDAQPLPDFSRGFSLENYLGTLRNRLFEHALEKSQGNQSEAARLLGLTPQAVNKYIKSRPAGESDPQA